MNQTEKVTVPCKVLLGGQNYTSGTAVGILLGSTLIFISQLFNGQGYKDKFEQLLL